MSDHHSALYDRELKSLGYAPAGTAVTGAGTTGIYDMQGWDGIEFVLALGVMDGAGSGVLSFTLYESSAANMGASTAVAGGSVSSLLDDTATNGFAVVDYRRPKGRYVRAVCDPGAGTVGFAILVTQYGRTGILPVAPGTAQTVYSGTAVEYVAASYY